MNWLRSIPTNIIYIVAAIAVALIIAGLIFLLLVKKDQQQEQQMEAQNNVVVNRVEEHIVEKHIYTEYPPIESESSESSEDGEDSIEIIETRVDSETGNTINVVLERKRKLEARLSTASDEVKSRYEELVNKIMMIKGAHNRLSTSFDTYKANNIVIAKLTLKGNVISLFLPLKPGQFQGTKYTVRDISNMRKHEATPSLYKVVGPRTLAWALELLDGVRKKFAFERYDESSFTPVDIKALYPYKTKPELMDAGLMTECLYKETLDPTGKRLSYIKKTDESKLN